MGANTDISIPILSRMKRGNMKLDLSLDYHAHILPGCDHGSDGLATSLKQVEMAVSAGVKTICATPHFYPHKESVESFLRRRKKTAGLLLRELPENAPLIQLGAEVLICDGMERLDGLNRLCREGTNELLLEMPFYAWPESIWDTLYVFHAAALKQVPSCEFYPMEAVKTNVAGSDNVISACVTNHVKKAIFLSTDKAAYPINAMGMTKAVMEKNVIARSRQMLPGDPVLCLTRYGNVMASRGAVIPLFCDQIDEGKPLTITNPNMTRFMMTLSDAVDLVLYAFEHGEQGDLFVQKAPAATIETLAQAVLELKHSNLGTTIIGTRHGEKLFEVLVTAEEMMRAEELPGFFRIPADNRDLNYDNYFSKGNPEFGKIEQYTSHNTHRLNVEEMKQLLLKLKLFGGTC